MLRQTVMGPTVGWGYADMNTFDLYLTKAKVGVCNGHTLMCSS